MAGNEIERPKSSRAKATPKRGEKVEALGMEIGTDLMPFSTTYINYSRATGLKKTDDEELREIGREDGEDWGPTVRQLVAMRRMDGQARALYRLITLPIRAALSTATIVPEEDGEKEADFIDRVFNTPPQSGGMTVTMHRFMSQLLQGIFDGFAAFEKVFWVPEFGPLKGKTTLKKLAHRPSDTITFLVDKYGGFAGFRQRAYDGSTFTDEYIPREYCFYFAAQEEERKFYGVSFFQSAFYHYDKKMKLYFVAHLAAQRAAVGTRVGTVPVNATNEAKREFASAMSNLAFAQYMMMPEGFKVDLLSESGNYDFLSQINHHNNQMSKSILANFFDKDQGSGQGESSLVNFAQPGDEMFLLMLRAVMDDIANQINHYIIPQLIDLNFKSDKYPKFTWGTLSDEQREAISSTFDKIANKETLTPEFIRALEEHQAKEFGLDIDYDEVDLREQEEAEAQAAAGVDEFGNPLPGAPGELPPGGEEPPAGGEFSPEEEEMLDDDDGEPMVQDTDSPPAPPEGEAPEDSAAAEEGFDFDSFEDSVLEATGPASSREASPAGEQPPASGEEAPPADEEPEGAGGLWGMGDNWTLDEFEEKLVQASDDDLGAAQTEEEDEIEDFERRAAGRITLSEDEASGEALIALAREMLDMAGGSRA